MNQPQYPFSEPENRDAARVGHDLAILGAGRSRRTARSAIARALRCARAGIAGQWRAQGALQRRLLELNAPWLAGRRPASLHTAPHTLAA